MSAPHAPTLSHASNRRFGDSARPLMLGGAGVGVAAIIISVIAAALSEHGWERFFKSYLTAFMFVVSVCLGALFFTMLHHATKAGWSVVLRRLSEAVASNFIWLWILFLPIGLSVALNWTHAYHWLHPEGDEILLAKSGYFFWPLSHESHFPMFWILRAIVFLSIWAFLGWFFYSNSVAQDATGDRSYTRKMESFAPPAFILFALSLAFAAIDWMMSLEPHWFSTMFPVYFFAASCCGFFAAQILIMFFLQRSGRLTLEISDEHYHDAGKLLFAFGIVFWAYIAFSQYMLIWYANIPEETNWYLTRQSGGWLWVSLLLLFGHFFGPFLILISRHPKRMKPVLAAAAAWMLFVHFIDIYWLVMPTVPLAKIVAADNSLEFVQSISNADLGYGWHVLDVTLLIALSALLVAGTVWRLTGCSLIPERDPRLHESLAFENV